MRKRTIIAVGILLVGVVGASWLVFGDKTNAGNIDVSISGAENNKDARFADANGGAANEGNATENAIREYGLEILRLNAQGQGLDKPVTIPSDETLKNIIAKQTEKPIPVTLFEEKDITVSKTSSRETKIAYFKTVGSYIQKDLSSIVSNFYTAIATFTAKKDSTDLGEHVNKTETYINDLLTIPVPYDLVALHLEMLNLWQRRLTYATIILNSSDDQLKSISALNQLSTLNTDEANFALTLKDYIQKLK